MLLKNRIFIKGLLWELLGIPIAYIVFGTWKGSFIYIIVRIFLYYLYHMLWKETKWLK